MVNVGLRGYIWQQKSEKAQIRREVRGGTVIAGNAQPEYGSLSKQALCAALGVQCSRIFGVSSICQVRRFTKAALSWT